MSLILCIAALFNVSWAYAEVNSQSTGNLTNYINVQAIQLTSTGNSYTMAQIEDAAKRVKAYVDTNKRLPSYVNIANKQVKMPDFLYLLVSASINLNVGNKGNIAQYTFQNPSSSFEALKSGSLYKTEYINIAKQIKYYMGTNGKAPSNVSSSLGKIRYESQIYMYSKIVNFYGQNNRLPDYVSLSAWTGPTISQPTNVAPSSSAPKMRIIVTGTGGDVTRNYYIRQNLPSSQLTSQVVTLAKKGTPMIIFGNGTGPRVMITAGVHGNELPAQIAAMKLANYLKGKSIKGTIYIVPFVAPSSTAQNIRYWNGENLNSVANVAGTPTNKIVNLEKQLGVKALGDFHSTQPGGFPGKNSVFCTKAPTYESYSIATCISKQTWSALVAYNRAGVKYPGALEDVSNLARIPAVTNEVLSPHGVVASGSVSKSYSQMIALLRYKKII